MNEHQKKLLRMTAAMEGEESITARIGGKVTLSEMELICLANFAEIGIMSVFSSLDGPSGDEAQRSLEDHVERIRQTFSSGDNSDGLNRLSTSTAAMLRGKFHKYIA